MGISMKSAQHLFDQHKYHNTQYKHSSREDYMKPKPEAYKSAGVREEYSSHDISSYSEISKKRKEYSDFKTNKRERDF